MMRWKTILCLLAIMIVGACGSASAPNTPKQTVIAFFGAMERDDKAALVKLLDIVELMKITNQDYSLSRDSARVFTTPEDILSDLTGEGKTKQRWFSMQRIINEARLVGEDNATVEVTFVDKEASKGYLTEFGLHKLNGTWKIYSFQTNEAPPETQ